MTRARLAIGAWLLGWLLIISAATATLATLWPALPRWTLPALIVGALMIHEALEEFVWKMGQEAESRKAAEDDEH